MADPAPSDLAQDLAGLIDFSGPGILGLFSQGVLTDLLIFQFSTFLDHLVCKTCGLVALAVFKNRDRSRAVCYPPRLVCNFQTF